MNTWEKKPRFRLQPFAPVLEQLAERLVLIEENEPGREPVGDRQMIEGVEDSGKALVGKAFDGDAADEPVADPRRVAGPQLLAAHVLVEIHRDRRNVERGQLAGEAELEIAHQFVAQMLAAVGVDDRMAAHAPEGQGVAEGVLEVVERPLEIDQLARGRALGFGPLVVVIDDVGQLAVPQQAAGSTGE